MNGFRVLSDAGEPEHKPSGFTAGSTSWPWVSTIAVSLDSRASNR